MDWTKILEGIKLSPKYLAAIALASGLPLFGPERLQDALGLKSWLATYRAWFGLAFVVSAALLIVHLVHLSWQKVSEGKRRKRQRTAGEKRLRNLTPEERSVLAGYILRNTRTQQLRIGSGVVAGLEHEDIIYRSTSFGKLDGFAYNIREWAWDYLQQNPQLVIDASAT